MHQQLLDSQLSDTCLYVCESQRAESFFVRIETFMDISTNDCVLSLIYETVDYFENNVLSLIIVNLKQKSH